MNPDPYSNPSARSDRASRRKSLKSLPKFRFVWMLIATLILWWWIFKVIASVLFAFINYCFARLQGWLNWESAPYYQPSPWIITGVFLLSLLLSPLLLDRFLEGCYPLQSFPLTRLETRYPLTKELIDDFSRKHRFLAPKLRIIKTDLPTIVTYGGLPFTTQIAISEGLLKILEDTELVSIYALQCGHILGWDFPFISGMVALLQLPYFIYLKIAVVGDRTSFIPLKIALAVFASLFYRIYSLARLGTLWLSRIRVYYADRYSVDTCKDPNILGDTLLKIADRTAKKILDLGYTPDFLDRFDILLPIDPRPVFYPPSIPKEVVLAAEYRDKNHHGLSLQSSHPFLGERIYIFNQYARFWGVKPSLKPPDPDSKSTFKERFNNLLDTLPLLLRAYFLSTFFAVILRVLFWLVGTIAHLAKFQPLTWMYGYSLLSGWLGWVIISLIIAFLYLIKEKIPYIFPTVVILYFALELLKNRPNFSWLINRDPLWEVCLFIGLSYFLIHFLNRDFQEKKVLENPDTGELIGSENGTIVILEGKLLGRSTIGNSLGRDLILKTATGAIRLNYLTVLGKCGDLISGVPLPCRWSGREVTVRGWYRVGSVDIEEMTTGEGEKIYKSKYPIEITVLALLCALRGAYGLLKV